MQFDWNSGELAAGLECFRAAQFFAAHEHWEAVWLTLQEPQKTFLQALIQVAGAFHHWQRGKPKGTTLLLEAAQRRLAPYPECYEGVAVALLRGQIGQWLQLLKGSESASGLPFPIVQTDA